MDATFDCAAGDALGVRAGERIKVHVAIERTNTGQCFRKCSGTRG